MLTLNAEPLCLLTKFKDEYNLLVDSRSLLVVIQLSRIKTANKH